MRQRGAGVSEWYTAGPLGIEQGFTLSRRPAGRSGAVTLSLALAGSPARMSGQGVEFMARSGRVALRYGGLVASDARGRRLPARLSLSGSRLRLRVADRGARYPLRTRPIHPAGVKADRSERKRSRSVRLARGGVGRRRHGVDRRTRRQQLRLGVGVHSGRRHLDAAGTKAHRAGFCGVVWLERGAVMGRQRGADRRAVY